MVKGKTAQFWLSYLEMIQQQHYFHVGIHENSFEAYMNAWEYFLPYYFVMNKIKLRQIRFVLFASNEK